MIKKNTLDLYIFYSSKRQMSTRVPFRVHITAGSPTKTIELGTNIMGTTYMRDPLVNLPKTVRITVEYFHVRSAGMNSSDIAFSSFILAANLGQRGRSTFHWGAMALAAGGAFPVDIIAVTPFNDYGTQASFTHVTSGAFTPMSFIADGAGLIGTLTFRVYESYINSSSTFECGSSSTVRWVAGLLIEPIDD